MSPYRISASVAPASPRGYLPQIFFLYLALDVSLFPACGGRPYTLIEEPPETGSMEASREGGEEQIEGPGSEASTSPEASACSTEPISVGYAAYACPADPPGSNQVPTYFSWTQNGGTGCGWALTPQACQCAGAYTCACLKAQGACSSFGNPTWTMIACVDGSAVTAVCQEAK